MEVRDLPTSSFVIKLSSILGVGVSVFLLDWCYFVYMTSHGLDLKTQTFTLGSMSVSIQLTWLPVFGVVLLSLVTWYEAYYRIFPRRGIEIDPLARIRLARVIVFSLALFVVALYVPSLISSSWFWTGLSEAGKNIVQVRDFASSLLNYVEPLTGINLLWQYSVSQTLAPAVMVLGAWAFGRAVRRVRK